MDDTVAVSLFRHGLTEENKRRAYLGWSDSPLCPEAKKELKLEKPDFDLVISSDLGRCLETADILFPDSRAEVMKELREMDFGQWEGKTYGELKDDSHYQSWLNDFLTVHPPGGESFTQFACRTEEGWRRISARILDHDARKTAVITHGGVIRHLLSQLAPVKREFWEWSIPHDRGYELVWHKKDLRRGERCILLREVPLMANPIG
ncbi:histidine phosphatase family protein [Mesobacillus foraminis]|uniref:histidine phosphatase family protein n=1 Tax=Mesobacillus foraminis TaxID=279826 RepID=UPI000EF4D7FA|nr:histidine phosphatase family protein [Mesobacillus foraminis]